MIASMGLLFFMTGEKGRRVIPPGTSILSHRFSSINMGNHSQLIASRKEEDLEHQRIIEHYMAYSSVKNQKVLEDEKAHKLSSEANISTTFAINLILNKHTLKEAKRRYRLKMREEDGRSVDMFDIGSRVSGSFGSKQK